MIGNDEVNLVSVTPIGNSVSILEPGNRVEVDIFSVTSTYFLLTQFQPYRHDTKVGENHD